MQSIDPRVKDYLDRVVEALRSDLGDDLVGVYLHGSLAMGAFDLGRSDVDIVAVCARELPEARRLDVGRHLDALPRPAPGLELEFSLVTAEAAGTPVAEPPFEVHVTTHDRPSVVDGHGGGGDRDLVVHFAMIRARGRALEGPDPADLFPEPDRRQLIAGFLHDMRWCRETGAAAWEGHHEPEFAWIAYRILNAARSWRYLETGALGSKVEGAEWLRANPSVSPGDVALVDVSLVFQHGGPAEQPPLTAVEDFVTRIESSLQGAIDEA